LITVLISITDPPGGGFVLRVTGNVQVVRFVEVGMPTNTPAVVIVVSMGSPVESSS
jgi:hypothetical protein